MGGVSATQKFMGSYTQGQVTVYNAGTLTLSTIYSDNSSTPKANPFTSSTTGYFFFYSANGRYDVTFSGGGLSAPLTFGDVLLADPFASGGAVTSFNGRTGAVVPAANDYTLAQISGFPASSSELQFFRRKANQGATAVYEFATEPVAVSTSYNFTQLAPAENISPTLRTMTLVPVPLGINAADTFHYVGIYNNAGTWQENVLINGGSAVSGATTGTITVAAISGTYATGAYKIGSISAGMAEALSTLGVSQGTVLVPNGKFDIYGPTRIQYSSQGIVGTGSGSYLNKKSAAGNLIEVQGNGEIDFNFVENLLITTDGPVTPTGGAMIYTDTLAKVGRLRGITMQTVWYGLQHFGPNWTLSDITVIFTANSAASYAFWLRGGQCTNLQAVQPLVTPGRGVGIFVDGPCDGLQITDSFIEGGFQDALSINPTDALTTGRVIDVNISNSIFDNFVRSAVVIQGLGEAALINFSNCHFQNQLPHATNQPLIWFTNVTSRQFTITGSRFLYGNKEFILCGATNQSDIVITGNQFLNGSFGAAGANAGLYSAVYLSNINHAVIVGNNFTSFDASAVTHKYDIELQLTIVNANVSNNVLRGWLTAALLLPATLTTSTINGNQGVTDIAGPRNYYTDGGANNAITATMTGVTLLSGLVVTIKLAHSLQAGANTFNAVAIKSSRNPANNIATAYAATGTIALLYDSTGPYYLDLSQ